MSAEPSVAVPPPPQAAARSRTTRASPARSVRCFIEKAPFAADSSRCPARGQYSIDQTERLREALFAERDLTVGDRVDGGRNAVAEASQLARAEDDLPDAHTAAAKDKVVRPELRHLQLCLLDQEQVLDRLGKRAEPVLRRGLQLAQLVLRLGEREPAVQVDLQRLRADVIRRHVGVDACVHTHRARSDAPLSRQLGNRFGKELDVELEAERRDMARLLVTKQIA